MDSFRLLVSYEFHFAISGKCRFVFVEVIHEITYTLFSIDYHSLLVYVAHTHTHIYIYVCVCVQHIQVKNDSLLKITYM